MRAGAAAWLAAAWSCCAWAGAETDWQRCRELHEDAARLACYDAQAAAIPERSAQFGAEQLQRDAAAEKTDEVLHSRVIGELQGWDARTVFRLENGQAWQNVDERSTYFRASNPSVTLSKGLFGGYWLELDELQLRTRVRRIR